MGIAGVDTPNYVISLVNSGQVCGADCIGASPSQVMKRRRYAQRNIVRSSAGRSATIDSALSRAKTSALDPEYSLSSAPIFALAASLWGINGYLGHGFYGHGGQRLEMLKLANSDGGRSQMVFTLLPPRVSELAVDLPT